MAPTLDVLVLFFFNQERAREGEEHSPGGSGQAGATEEGRGPRHQRTDSPGPAH